MRSETHLGTSAEVLRDASPTVSAIAYRLQQLIEELHPDVVEVPRAGERTISYGIGPKKMSEAYAYLAPQRNRINLGFFHGAGLADPAGLLEGSGKALRHVKITTLEQAESPAIRELLLAAIAERRRVLQRYSDVQP
ncbi:MAG TPA: DUF1801 domain-containing protein [Roseiflexaceae bacterium]|nr:DUF1801 domain-containing protein [Roseiflexaceae bacterium]HMP42243.1 DUF1801 domain-containing protein [Roseiflexaceae bacterium]